MSDQLVLLVEEKEEVEVLDEANLANSFEFLKI